MALQPILSCSGISIRFGGEVVLNDFSFEILKGRHTVLKGESGSGKSTLLKLLLGFLKPFQGQIIYYDYSNSHSFRQHSAWLPQDLDLGDGTVEKVMRKPFQFVANQSRMPGRERYRTILAELGMAGDHLSKQFRDLSTGQRQRIGLAICYLLDKPVLLLDEPTSALDEASKERMAHLLVAHTNKTVISTSHDPFWVAYADHIIELS